jgi:hypothetical protein
VPALPIKSNLRRTASVNFELLNRLLLSDSPDESVITIRQRNYKRSLERLRKLEKTDQKTRAAARPAAKCRAPRAQALRRYVQTLDRRLAGMPLAHCASAPRFYAGPMAYSCPVWPSSPLIVFFCFHPEPLSTSGQSRMQK